MENVLDTEDFYTVSDFAKKLKVHKNTILRAIRRGKIQAINMGTEAKTLYRIPGSEIHRLGVFNLNKIIEKIIEEREKGEK